MTIPHRLIVGHGWSNDSAYLYVYLYCRLRIFVAWTGNGPDFYISIGSMDHYSRHAIWWLLLDALGTVAPKIQLLLDKIWDLLSGTKARRPWVKLSKNIRGSERNSCQCMSFSLSRQSTATSNFNGRFQTSRNCVWLETVSSYVSDFAVLAQGLCAVGNVESARSSICPTLDQICQDAARGTKEWPLTRSVANLVEQLQGMLQMLVFS